MTPVPAVQAQLAPVGYLVLARRPSRNRNRSRLKGFPLFNEASGTSARNLNFSTPVETRVAPKRVFQSQGWNTIEYRSRASLCQYNYISLKYKYLHSY